MKKAILIIDMPNNCEECGMHHRITDNLPENWCGVTKKEILFPTHERPDWCPLREAPKHMLCFCEEDDYMSGYNDCLEEILRE